MSVPSGEKAARDSRPACVVSREARPPATFTCHRSPSAVKTSVSRNSAGNRK